MGCNAIVVGRSEFSLINSDVKPDTVLNLGTGSLLPCNTQDVESQSFKKKCGLTRLGDAYMALTQGRKTWEDTVCLSQNGSAESGHYRLDVALKNDVRLDNTSAMPLLQSLMLKDQHLPRIIKEIAQRLFAALFYFELTSIPIRSGTRHHVEGQILCKRKAGDPALCQIVRRLGSSTILIDGKAVRETPIQDIHHNINLQLSFVANESVSIHLKESHTGHSFPLSGAPYNLSRQVARGGLAASFGTSTHKRGGSELYGRPARRRRNH
jgi:hypothetical protein